MVNLGRYTIHGWNPQAIFDEASERTSVVELSSNYIASTLGTGVLAVDFTKNAGEPLQIIIMNRH